jgi:PAS domain S-box-containing protein
VAVPLPGYFDFRLLRTSARCRVYEATRERDALRVVAKVYEVEDPVIEARVEQEFQLVQRLTSEGVVRALGLERIANDLVLIFEHVEGMNLEQYAGGKPLAIDEFLSIAIALSRTLAAIHEQRIVHRDIKPSNLLIRPGPNPQIFIADFGISDLLDNERRHLYEADVLRGSLPYISPEQTGRINRRVDSRSDLYSLGVTFYELLTGVRPLQGATTAALIHAHLTRRPQAVRALQPGLPAVLGAVVQRLLEKTPELRYQSARGLLVDLERIAESIAAGQPDPEFPLGQHDQVGVLQLPMRLYGREPQLETLERELDDAHAFRQRRAVVVRAPAGLGKSALVKAFERTLQERDISVAIGTFEPPPQQIPYQGVTRALSGLVEQTLTATDAVLEGWKDRLRARLGDLAPAAAELVPSLNLVLGEQQLAVVDVGLADDRHRLHRAIGRLLDALAERGPLVLVLDDFQWAGAASVDLLRALLRPTKSLPGGESTSAGSLLLVLCVRPELDDERGQLVARLLDELDAGPSPPTTLELAPLRQPELEQMLADMLGREPPELVGLAKLISTRSENVPLFVHQLLLHLVDRSLLRLGASGWEWDEQAIASSALPDDMLGVMTDKLARMPEGERELLQIAACIGARFDPALLEAFVHEHGELVAKGVAVIDSLRRLTHEGLLLALADGYQFSHERIRLGAQDSLPVARRKSIHYALGRHLLVRQRGREIGDEVFLLVDQLRAGIDDADDLHGVQSAELGKLAHQAGTRAMRAHAWIRARRYLEFARELITTSVTAIRSPQHSGSVMGDMRALMLAIHTALAQVLASLGEAEAAEKIYDELLSWPLGRLDRASIVSRRLRLLTLQGRISEALADGLAFLTECGLELPERPTPARMLVELLRTWWRYRDVDLPRLDALTPATDERAVAAILVLAAAKGPAYVVRPRLFVVLTSVHARLLLAHGTHPSMPLALAHLAICELALGSTPRQLAQLERLCEAALELGARPWSASPVLAHTAVLLFVWPSIRPFRTITREIELAHQRSLDTGDLENSGYIAALGFALHLEDGSHLRDVLDLHDRLISADPAWGTLELAKVAELSQRFVLCLRGSDEDADAANPPSLMSRSELAGLELSRVTHYACVVIEAFGRWLLGERERVAELIGSIDGDFERVLFGTWQVPRCALLGSLIEFDRAWRSTTRVPVRGYLGKRRALLKRWAQRCPANYGALALLFEAELASLRRRNGPAQDFYERAIATAVEHGLHAIEALVCERFALHARRRGHLTTTDGALRQAHLALHRWGARAAVSRFEREYPDVFTDAQPIGERDMTTNPSGSNVLSEVDNAAVLRILETIGADLRLDEVVVRVLRSACESAGADHGALLLERDAGLGLVAEYGVRDIQGAELVEPAILLETIHDRLPTSAVQFVRRTGRALLIDDITLDPRFAHDPYVLATEVRSLICMPIDKHGQRVGALLLTNHLSSHAFTADRFGLLGVLTGQAAHALENAQLYDALQRGEAKWRALVAGLPDIITLIDERGRVEFINHLGALSASGMKPEQLIGMPVLMMTTPENHEEYGRCLDAAFQRCEYSELEIEYKLTIGTFWYQIRFAPIVSGGRVVKIINIGTDISARRRAEQGRAQLEAQLRQQQRLESVGTLASGVAHEINNPVQGIMNYAELISAKPDDADQVREFAGEIVNESQRVATIVRNLLAFSRQEREQAPELVDVPHVIETTLALIRTILRKDQIELELELADDLPQIRCRPQQIHQILMNLVTNARDAANEAGGRKLVRLRATALQRDGRAWVRISVQDTGAGIPDSIRRRIFDPFFTTKRHDKGTGLGLAVSHGIAVDHGGKIEVESEVGVGSIFHLELPGA